MQRREPLGWGATAEGMYIPPFMLASRVGIVVEIGNALKMSIGTGISASVYTLLV